MGGQSPLVVGGSLKEVIENLENNSDATLRLAKAGLTARNQST